METATLVATKTKPRSRKPTPPASTLTPARTQQDEWIGTAEVARLLGRPQKTVLRLGETGVLTMNRPGTARARFRKSEVLKLARDNGLEV